MRALKYKGFVGSVELDSEAGVLFGKLIGTTDLVTYEAEKAKDIMKEFKSAADDYIALCKEIGKEPIKPFTGTFNVRIKKELHQKVVFAAATKGVTLNSIVEKSIEEYVTP